ncbi:2Fe-2S iron-sulfur cluster binding domain-containing protein [bacterium]|nr:2Fe-2S iron-sulfur cluster binding domain-containing protein [bacterium]
MSDTVKLTIDHMDVEVPRGTTVLEAARELGLRIPTLCHLEGVHQQGVCRVCVVELEGRPNLLASCVLEAANGMRVRTNSMRVLRARNTVFELMLSDHHKDCLGCDRNTDCELQELAMHLGVDAERFAEDLAAPRMLDISSQSLVRDSGKCILCRRCVSVCEQVQTVGTIGVQERGSASSVAPAFVGLGDAVCVNCGQCAAVCPVNAIFERDHVHPVEEAIIDPAKHVVVQTAPAIRAAIGETQGMPAGSLVTGQLVTALKMMGFDAVFDTNWSADLTILEEGMELLARLKRAVADGDSSVALPMMTSCSPGWVKFLEHFYPDLTDNLSTAKSPQQMLGTVIKTYYAQNLGLQPEDIVVVSVMPCTAKKFEASRPEMTDSGVRDVDYVVTTRELGRMIRKNGLDFANLPAGEFDDPLGRSSGAADIFANSGGVMEAALRTVHEVVTGRELPFANLHVTDLMDIEGVREVAVTFEDVTEDYSWLEGVTAKLAVTSGLGNARELMDRVSSGQAEYHFIEVMGCPGGCIGGGGQPRPTTDAVRRQRFAAICAEDEGKPLRKSHENPLIDRIYADFLGEPNSHKAHELLHTHYVARDAY